jgi:hypothetical protein
MCIRCMFPFAVAALVWALVAGCENPTAPYDTSAAPELLSPLDSLRTTATVVTFEWSGVPDATHYELQVSRDGIFDAPALDCSTVRTSYDHAIDSGRVFCWRVRAKHGAQTGAWSRTRMFIHERDEG